MQGRQYEPNSMEKYADNVITAVSAWLDKAWYSAYRICMWKASSELSEISLGGLF